MNDESERMPEPGEPAVIRPRWRVSLIWLVPVVAALIGISMLVHAWLSIGPEISVTFRTAAGLEAGRIDQLEEADQWAEHCAPDSGLREDRSGGASAADDGNSLRRVALDPLAGAVTVVAGEVLVLAQIGDLTLRYPRHVR